MNEFFVVSVSPLERVSQGLLDYFSLESYPRGSIIEIPYGKRVVDAVVLSSKPAKLSKSELRKNEFALKKLKKQKPRIFLPQAYLAAIQRTASLHGTSFGSCLLSCTPKRLFDRTFGDIEFKEESRDSATKKKAREFAVQDEFVSRITILRSIIRETHAKGEHVFIIAPSRNHLELLSRTLEIEKQNVIHGDSKKNELLSITKRVTEGTERLVVCSTPKYLFLTAFSRSTIILELEGSGWYKEIGRPFIDTRLLARAIQEQTGGDLIRSDTLLDILTIHRHKTGKIKERYAVDFTVEGTAVARIIDMKESSHTSFRGPDYSALISPELERVITSSIENKERLVLYTLRKGFQPVLMCQDCGERVIRKKYFDDILRYKKGVFTSSSLPAEDAERMVDRCSKCGSWRLRPVAIAVLKVLEMLREKFGDNFALVHGDMNSKEQLSSLKSFEVDERYPVLLTTEAGLYSLTKRVERSAVVSFDALFSIPDIGISEKTMRILLRLHELSKAEVLIQTRNPRNRILEQFEKGTILPLYRRELEERKMLGYPPFVRIAKLRINARNSRVKEQIDFIRTIFKDFKKEMYPSFHNARDTETIVILIKALTKKEWKDILLRLRSLPLDIEVDATPQSLL